MLRSFNIIVFLLPHSFYPVHTGSVLFTYMCHCSTCKTNKTKRKKLWKNLIKITEKLLYTKYIFLVGDYSVWDIISCIRKYLSYYFICVFTSYSNFQMTRQKTSVADINYLPVSNWNTTIAHSLGYIGATSVSSLST